jgi:hypothetical protein
MTELALKQKAEDILATKMCRCIKAVQQYNASPEKNAIAICRESVLKKKNLNNYTFTCKKKVKFNLPKGQMPKGQMPKDRAPKGQEKNKTRKDALIKTKPTLFLYKQKTRKLNRRKLKP